MEAVLSKDSVHARSHFEEKSVSSPSTWSYGGDVHGICEQLPSFPPDIYQGIVEPHDVRPCCVNAGIRIDDKGLHEQLDLQGLVIRQNPHTKRY